MNPNYAERARARELKALVPAIVIALAGIAALAAPGARAQDRSAAPLTLPAAADLAVKQQPLLAAQQQAARAARESAVAAAQLPDPVLSGGLANLPLDGPDRYSLDREPDTQYMLGVKQAFPGAGKRDLRGARGRLEADRLDAELDESQRMVRREAALAWLEVWKAVQGQALVRQSIVEGTQQLQAVDIAYRSGRGTQADLLGARVALEMLGDQLAGLEQDEAHARNQLRRWIGADADRPLVETLPPWTAPDLAGLEQHLEHHPHVQTAARTVEVARAELDLAKAEVRPDWSVQAGYGYRPSFPDYASLQFEIALPVFAGNRQDRGVAARAAELARAEDLRDDLLKQHRAAVALNVADAQKLQVRLERYDTAILPQAQARQAAALAAYGAGGSSLLALLDARRSLLDVRLQRLALQLDAARHQVELEYFAYQESQP